MRHHPSRRNILWTVLFPILATLFLNACSDTNNVSDSLVPAVPGPLTILTASPLPAGTVQADYNVTLAPSGGTPPYTWSLTPGSPALPDGLALTPSNGKILGVPTTPTGTRLIEFKLKDSKGESVQKVLAMTVNAAPTPLAILTNSLPSGSINQLYAVALSPTGGISPYTWNLKNGSPPLPNGLTLTANGVISGTPTVTSSATHIFTLTDATSLTVEKALHLSINAIPLSITTNSPLPQGTVNQPYTRTLIASGGTSPIEWNLESGSLPAGLALSTAGVISGTPTAAGTSNFTVQVTDSTPPTPQTTTKSLQLIIGAAAPTLTITIPAGNSLPGGSVGSAYNTSLDATGGTGAQTWSISSGALPNGLSLNPATGAITGTLLVGSNGTTSLTVQVEDSGTPQQSAQKTLSITIGLPTPPNITTTSLPAGTSDVAYNETISVTGGIGTLVWGVTSGALPPGLDLNPSNGNISGTPITSGLFEFTLRVTDSIPQFDDQNLTITVSSPTPP